MKSRKRETASAGTHIILILILQGYRALDSDLRAARHFFFSIWAEAIGMCLASAVHIDIQSSLFREGFPIPQNTRFFSN